MASNAGLAWTQHSIPPSWSRNKPMSTSPGLDTLGWFSVAWGFCTLVGQIQLSRIDTTDFRNESTRLLNVLLVISPCYIWTNCEHYFYSGLLFFTLASSAKSAPLHFWQASLLCLFTYKIWSFMRSGIVSLYGGYNWHFPWKDKDWINVNLSYCSMLN